MSGFRPEVDLRPTRERHLKTMPMRISKFLVKNFSSTSGRRNPPNPKKIHHARLITIKPSHFCEKGRWALDLAEEDPDSPVYYTEDAHPPALSSIATVEASKDTSSQTPMVLLDKKDGKEPELLVKSDVILRRFCPNLYPKDICDKVVAMEDDLGQRLGAALRVYSYHGILQKDYFSSLSKVSGSSTSIVEALIFKLLLPWKGHVIIRKVMNVNETTAKECHDMVQTVFEEVSALLEKNGGQYILDESNKEGSSHGFTAADLTFAALAYPLLRPPQMARFNCNEIPGDVAKFAKTLEATLAGQHVMRMYQKHRLPKGQDVVVIKSRGRNRISMTIIVAMIARFAILGAIWYYRNMRNKAVGS